MNQITVQTIKLIGRPIAFILIIITLIEIAMIISSPSPAAFARPFEIIAHIPDFFLKYDGLKNIIATLLRTLLALAISIPVGVSIGFFAVKAPFFQNEIKALIDFFRSIPVTAMIPLLIVIFGIGSLTQVAAGTIGGSLAVAISIIVGFNGLNPVRQAVANSIGMKGFARLFYYEIPELSPSILVGIRTAASLSLVLVIVSEMLAGAKNGLGALISDLGYSDDVPSLYFSVLICGLIGFAINKFFYLLEKKIEVYFVER